MHNCKKQKNKSYFKVNSNTYCNVIGCYCFSVNYIMSFLVGRQMSVLGHKELMCGVYEVFWLH